MAAFWGFLSALLCVVCLIAGVIAGWYLRESYDKDKEKPSRRVNYTAYCDPKPSHGRYEWKDSPKKPEGITIINFGTPELIGEGFFYSEANSRNFSNLIYDPKTEDFIRDNGVHMYCQEIIREDLVKTLKEDGVAYIHWSGDNSYSQVFMKEDEAHGDTTDNETAGD